MTESKASEPDPFQSPSSLSSGAEGSSYWSRNLKRLAGLLLVWFLGSYGTSILFVDQLDKISFFGFRLGFWFSQQGSIYIFLALILVYIRMMNALDDDYEKRHPGHVEMDDDMKDEEVSS